MKVVLDAWAVAALFNDEPAADRVTEILTLNDCWISSVNLGEAYYISVRERGERLTSERIEELRRIVSLDHPNWSVAREAALIKAHGGLSYADAFCVATGRRHDAPVCTGDPEIIGLDDPGIEIVDLRTAP